MRSEARLSILKRLHIKINLQFTGIDTIIIGIITGIHIKLNNLNLNLNLMSLSKSTRLWFKKLQQLARRLRVFVSLKSNEQVWILWLLSSSLN